MSEPTKAQLQESVTKLSAKAQRFEQALAEVDGEARAYDRCVKALTVLNVSDRYGRGKAPDKEAIRRVLDTLKARFGIEDSDQQSHNTFVEQTWEPPEDPHDNFITQLVDALRKT